MKALFEESSWADLHLQIIFFGRQHCAAVRHDAAACPICSWAAVEGHPAPAVGETPGSAVKALPSTPRVATPAKRARKTPGKGAARELPLTP